MLHKTSCYFKPSSVVFCDLYIPTVFSVFSATCSHARNYFIFLIKKKWSNFHCSLINFSAILFKLFSMLCLKLRRLLLFPKHPSLQFSFVMLLHELTTVRLAWNLSLSHYLFFLLLLFSHSILFLVSLCLDCKVSSENTVFIPVLVESPNRGILGSILVQ